ncbi:MAG: (Fe-S)-binding protein, partial [Rhodospirillales bacterium]|nr:(Fe-S)-binding protein [Rhodospirillales bacterium]
MTAYADQLDSVVARAASACVSCGACFEACPTAREIGMARDGAVARVGELKALAAGEAAAPELTRWLDACDGSGRCVDACPENINVRQWIAVSRMKAVSAARPEEARRAAQAKRFRSMSQAVRLLGAMQLPSETLSRVLAPVETRHAEVLFYTGCNVLRTPHIVLNVMDILDTLGVDFDVVGGPSHCCGVYQFLEADLPTYERVGHRTFERFGKSGAKQVLTWCPTCTKNFDELEADPAPPSFDLAHISEVLAASLDRLRPAFVDLPPRRAVIHEHQGIGASLESVRALIRAVPNLTVVDFPQDSGFS